MTYQIKDVVLFREREYFIAGCSVRGFPFYPQDEGIEVVADSTDNSRGFYARYALSNNELLLCSVSVTLSDSLYRDVLKYRGIRLFQKEAVPVTESSEGTWGTMIAVARALSPFLSERIPDGIGRRRVLARNYVRFDDLWRVIPFTGGLLVGRNRDHLSGCFCPWQYDELWELVFEKGKLDTATNRSDAATAYRDWVRERQVDAAANPRNLSGTQQNEGRESAIASFKTHFSLGYNFDSRY